MSRLRSKLTYANVVSTLALFLVLAGGTAFAASRLAKNSVGTQQIKRNAVTAAKIKNGAVSGAKIDLGSLGTVPNAANAAHASKADSAVSAVSAATATNAANAGVAARAVTADSANAVAAPEALRFVGDPGQPPYGPGWEAFEIGLARPSFYEDREGVVHLGGTADGNNTSQFVFTLPAAYAPAEDLYFIASGSGGSPKFVNIEQSGKVRSQDTSIISLDGITWRAGE